MVFDQVVHEIAFEDGYQARMTNDAVAVIQRHGQLLFDGKGRQAEAIPAVYFVGRLDAVLEKIEEKNGLRVACWKRSSKISILS